MAETRLTGTAHRIRYAAIWIASALLLFAGPAAHADVFSFKSLGFSIDAPDGWVVISGEEFRRQAEQIDFGSDEMNALVEKAGVILSLLKNETQAEGVNPGFHVFKYPGQIPDAVVGAGNAEVFGQGNLTGFKTLDGPALDVIDGIRTGYLRYQYDAVAQSGDVLRVEERIWIVPFEGIYLTISTGAAPDAPDEDWDMLMQAARSLRSLN